MEGLEVSEVYKSNLEYSGRLDSEYYRSKMLRDELLISEKGGVKFGSIAKFLIGPFGSVFSTDNYTLDKSYRYVRGKDVKPMRLMDDDNVYLPKVDFERLSKYALKAKDLLVSVVGTIGNSAIVEASDVPAIFSCKNTVIRTNQANPHYLLAYLNSKYGRTLLLRKQRGAIQQGINLDDLKTLDIYLPSIKYQTATEIIYQKSSEQLFRSRSKYSTAETLLLETLGLTNFNASTVAVNIKSFKDSFLSFGRIDAEYYQKKYEDWVRAIRLYDSDCLSIAQACELNNMVFLPEQERSYLYIELSDIDKVGGITGVTIAKGEDLPTRARRLVKTGDVLVSSIEGSLSSCAIVSEKYNNAVCSTGFYVIRSNKMNSETLLLLMKSMPLQALLKQGCSGTILTAINTDAFLNLPIPLIDMLIQQKIANYLQESFKLKAQSERLLEIAKRAVEIAIEQDEAAGLAYVENNSNV